MRTGQNRACYFVLSEAEVSSLIHAATSFRNRTILRMLYLTGLRRQELCSLTIEDTDLERSRLMVRSEPPRDCRRPNSLRGWRHGRTEQVHRCEVMGMQT